MRCKVELILMLLTATSALGAETRRDRTPLQTYDDNLARGGTHEREDLLITSERSAIDRIVNRGRDLGCSFVRQFGRRPLLLFRCPTTKRTMRAWIARWERTEHVRWVEPSYFETADETIPNDLVEGQWFHLNYGQTIGEVEGIAGADIRSTRAWDITTGSRDFIILISDTGISRQHLDLAPQLWINDDEICNNLADDDGNGYVDDCHGFDFANDDNDPDPHTLPTKKPSGKTCVRHHGSIIAGLAGARGNNQVGVAGVNWNVRFMNVKKHRDASCASATSRSIESAAYAIDNGAHVISMSFSTSSYSATLEATLQEAEAQGLALVSSAGNKSENTDHADRYPNHFDLDHMLVVANSDNLNELYSSSNWGGQTVDLAAPGYKVLSTTVGSPHALDARTGTSYSTGVVAGAITLTWSAFPQLTASEVAVAIRRGVRTLPHLDCAQVHKCVNTGGVLDLYGALQQAAAIVPPDIVATLDELVLEPNETQTSTLHLRNEGQGPAYFLRGTISHDDPHLRPLHQPLSYDRIDPSTEMLQAITITRTDRCSDTRDARLQIELLDRFKRSFSLAPAIRLASCTPEPDAGVEEDASSADTLEQPDAQPQPDAGSQPIPDEAGCGCTASERAASAPYFFLRRNPL